MSALELDLNIKAQQKLVMTPKMQMAIRVLNMNSLEIKDFVSAQVMENPMLEIGKGESASEEERPEIDWQSYLKELDKTPAEQTAYDKDAEVWHPEPHKKNTETLESHLMLQLHLHGDIDQAVGAYIVGCIDSDGYLFMDEAAAAETLGVSEQEIEQSIAAIQTFDPIGVGARNIGECLSIQLKALGQWSEDRQMLLDRYLLPIANQEFKKVAAATGFSAAQLAAFKMQLTELNPRPGAVFEEDEPTEYIMPDGSIVNVDGRLVVHINEIGAPELTLSAVYRRMLAHPDCEKTQAYLEACLEKARFVISCIEMRRETIRKILAAIAEFQANYFFSRSHYLKPMTQSTVAERAGVHESTVSRAINGKYVRTPRGTFAIKDLFTHGVATDTAGTEISVDCIKSEIRQYIQDEDPAHPLSDQAISDLFAEKNVPVARRTVAKYRKAMGLPNASKRRCPAH
ncbi:MAG: RNA polymerase factor sigma-54 [Pseudoramibacter sp.]